MKARSIFLALLLFAAGLGIGYYVGHHSTVSNTLAAKSTLGPWKAKFTVPGSADLPEQSTVIKCRFTKPLEYGFGYMNVTLTNLDSRQFLVRYAVFGYNKKGQRISQGTDEFTIGRHESVVRKVYLANQESMMSAPGSAFWIEMELEE
jgi:hypothetical protein